MTEPRDPAARPSKPIAEGSLIADRYLLGPVIGRGGMATIHRATDVRLDRKVAVKLLRPEIGADPDLAQRFRREALAATVLRHPNIVACLDTGTEGDQPFLVMELVEGEDLAARLKRGGRLAPAQAARIGLDVARAVGVAHVRGIVHRDIKPGNVLLAGDGRAMVTDFGIARLAVDQEASLPGTTLGSVHYFSPEQARGTTTTPASDVYSLGLVLYEALTGQRAWTGDTTDAIALVRVGAAAPSPRAIRPEVPASFDAVVRRALAPEPTDRYANGASLASAIEPIVAAMDPASPTATIQTPVPTTTGAATSTSVEPARGTQVEPARGTQVEPARGTQVEPARGAEPAPAIAPAMTPRGAAAATGSSLAPAIGGSMPSIPQPIRLPGSGGRVSVIVGVLALVGMLGGALAVASASRGDGFSLVPPITPAAETEPPATAPPTPEPTPEPTAVPATPEPTVNPTPLPAGEVAELCDPVFGLACGLGAGRYEINVPPTLFDVKVGDGWSVAMRSDDVAALRRDEGLITFAGDVTPLDDKGRPAKKRERARDVVAAFAALDGFDSTKAANVRIDGRRGRSVDLTATRPGRVAAFTTNGTTYFLEPGRTTRLVALDVDGGVLVLAIEPDDGSTLEDILATADAVAASMRFN